jgi:hypothetical protein
MRFCMASAIATQASASSLTPRLLGVAEEHHDGSAEIFADRRAVLERRHLGQAVVEELDQVLGLARATFAPLSSQTRNALVPQPEPETQRDAWWAIG